MDWVPSLGNGGYFSQQTAEIVSLRRANPGDGLLTMKIPLSLTILATLVAPVETSLAGVVVKADAAYWKQTPRSGSSRIGQFWSLQSSRHLYYHANDPPEIKSGSDHPPALFPLPG